MTRSNEGSNPGEVVVTFPNNDEYVIGRFEFTGFKEVQHEPLDVPAQRQGDPGRAEVPVGGSAVDAGAAQAGADGQGQRQAPREAWLDRVLDWVNRTVAWAVLIGSFDWCTPGALDQGRWPEEVAT